MRQTCRLSQSAEGRLIYQLKQRWRDGTTHVGFEPLELLEKLAALAAIVTPEAIRAILDCLDLPSRAP